MIAAKHTWLAIALVAAFGCEKDEDVRGAERAIDPDPLVDEERAERKVEPEGDPTALPSQDVPERARVGVRRSEYLVGDEGYTLYVFTADRQGEASNCLDGCAEAWPPLLTRDAPESAAAPVQGNLLGTIERPDGTRQVTYGGWPLYRYRADRQPGQITGQGQPGRGGVWYIINPEGEIIRNEGPDTQVAP